MTRELDDIRAMLRNLEDLRVQGGALSQRLQDLEATLREQRWLDADETADLAERLRRFALSQRALLAWAGKKTDEAAPSMEALAALLTAREHTLLEQDRLLGPCRAFLALESGDSALQDALTVGQKALRQAMEAGEDLTLWSAGCAALLEQLTARDYSCIGSIMQQFGAIFDFTLVAGVYSGAITAPVGAAMEAPLPSREAEPPTGAEEPSPQAPYPPVEEAAPEVTRSPVEAEPVHAPEPVAEKSVETGGDVWPGTPAAGEDSPLTFASHRRLETPSWKKFHDFFFRGDFSELYFLISHYLVFSRETWLHDGASSEASLNQAVREGYLTEICTAAGRIYYQTSPKLASAMKKQSAQHFLQRHALTPASPAFDENRLNSHVLAQVDGVETALDCLYRDQRLKYWDVQRQCLVKGPTYWSALRFSTEAGSQFSPVMFCLADPGADLRPQFLELLNALLHNSKPPFWAAVPTRAEIPRWKDYFVSHQLPLPSWLPLDEPGQILSSEGEAASLPEFFLGLQPNPATEDAPEPVTPSQPEDALQPAVAPEPATPPQPEDAPQPADAPEPVTPPHPEDAPQPAVAPEPANPPQPEELPGGELSRPGLFTLDVDLPALWHQAVEWFAKEEFPLGLCQLRVLRGLDKRQSTRCLQYVYALDDPAEPCQYLPDRLTQVYAAAGSGLEGDALSCLTLSAYLRMAFTAEAGQAWYQAADALQSMAADPLVEALPSVRAALDLLVRTLRERRRGFEPQLIRQCQMWGETNQKLDELARDARDIRDGRYYRVDVYTNRIRGLFQVLFGPQSHLMDCLSVVEENDARRREQIRILCAPLLGSDGRPDPRAVARYIDRMWEDQPSTHKQTEPLKGKARNLAFSRFQTCLEVCLRWLECSEAASIGQAEAEQILTDRDRLLGLFRAALRELHALPAVDDAQRYSAVVVLHFTLGELIRSLEGEPVDRRDFYVDFLRTGQVELNEALLPMFEAGEYIIPGFEPWRRLIEHDRRMLSEDGVDWDSVLERIWSGDGAAPDCYNFGTARLIAQATARQGLQPELLARADLDADIRKVAGMVDEEQLQFRARLELAATYGQIEDHARKEQLSNAVTEVLRDHYETRGNWGFYRRTMDACLAAVQREAERLEPRYRYEFDRLKETVPPCPMFDKVEQLLQEKMFSVAHNYMQLVVREDITVPPESNTLQKDPGSDHLRRFLSDYAPLSRLCVEERGQSRTLEHIYNQFAGDAGQDKNSTKRSARLMIRAWPKNNNNTPEMVQELLRHLSFPVRRVSRGRDVNTFQAEMTPTPAQVFTHPHPVAAFGTQLARTGLAVRVLSGRKTAEELVDLINHLGRTDTPVLFLLDYALPLAERNAMARKLKRESAHLSTCLVLDRILALFLTGFPDAERGKVLLQCALPFHFYNPYVRGDTPIPPEMFMGRKTQLEEILRNGGANIIYGGRQLGKTALLRRAADLVDDRENGRWAVYTDVLYRCDYPEALDKLYACLTACGFLKAAAGPASWDELCERIRARMDDPARRVERFLLLMDEADQFLASSSACSYRPVELLHQLQTATDGRFKYVLAGLHNVMRFSRDATRNNSILGKLGTLTIKPLTYQEASQLLEEPLYYLGFRLDKDQTVLLSQILLSTNYYPGLIHFYCAQLVESLCSGMGNADACPPYRLDENQIRVLLQKKDFTSQIRDKFFITLDVEEDKLYYRILAYALAYCYYDQPGLAVQGYAFTDILGVCRGFSIDSITCLPEESVKVLLSEMEELNVLVCMHGRYTFNGANFRHMMGDYDTVYKELDSFSEEEAQ